MTDELEELADAGVDAMGDLTALFEHHCGNGTWFAVGAIVGVGVLAVTHANPWLIGIGAMFVGWAMNEHERRRIAAELKSKSDQ
jgi:hypothetical protein